MASLARPPVAVSTSGEKVVCSTSLIDVVHMHTS